MAAMQRHADMRMTLPVVESLRIHALGYIAADEAVSRRRLYRPLTAVLLP